VEKRTLLVSLHDVTPLMFDRSKRISDLIIERIGTDFTMLVVPDFHSLGRIDKYPGFCTWLRELKSAGVEIAQHGLQHLCTTEQFSLKGKLFTKGEGEFVSLSRQEACLRIAAGFEMLSDVLGEPPSGFTAPAWLYSSGTRDALKEFSFKWIEYRCSIDYSDGTRCTAPAVVFASRTSWKRLCSVVWSSLGPAVFSGRKVFRLALHVRDLPLLEKPVVQSLEKSSASRASLTYAGFAR
jgi:predicted deacetylase